VLGEPEPTLRNRPEWLNTRLRREAVARGVVST
jgi:hypothetical protein